MPDFGGPPVGLSSNVTPSQGIQTLSGLLGLKRQQQELQVGAAEVQKAQREQAARQFMTNLMQSGKDEKGQSITGPDGQPDAGKTIAAVSRNLPADLAQPVIQTIIKSERDRVGLQAASAELDSKERAMLMGPVQAAVGDPNLKSADINAGIDNLVAAHPEMGNAAGYLKGLVSHLDNVPPDKRVDAINTIAAHMQPGEAVPTTPQPATVDTGTQLVQGTQEPAIAGGGFSPATSVQKQIPPGVVGFPSGSLGTVNAPPGTRLGAGGAPSGTGVTADTDPQRPGPNDPAWRQTSFGTMVQQAQHDVLGAQSLDSGYQTNMATADMIRRYSNDANTGPGTAGWTRFLGTIGTRLGTQNVADTQTLASFLDLQSSRLRESMGLPATNAGLATSQEMGTSIESQRKAIQAKTDYYQALTELQHLYRTGLDHAGNGGVNPSPTAVQQFKGQFASVADPIAVEIKLALQRGDRAAAQDLLKSLSPQQRQAVASHGRALDQMFGAQ